jgi:hypothetical protein
MWFNIGRSARERDSSTIKGKRNCLHASNGTFSFNLISSSLFCQREMRKECFLHYKFLLFFVLEWTKMWTGGRWDKRAKGRIFNFASSHSSYLLMPLSITIVRIFIKESLKLSVVKDGAQPTMIMRKNVNLNSIKTLHGWMDIGLLAWWWWW